MLRRTRRISAAIPGSTPLAELPGELVVDADVRQRAAGGAHERAEQRR
jgi:hypothetical protein